MEFMIILASQLKPTTMKTLEKHVIIYDCDCPMCKVYTSAFVKTGMLDENGRMPYNMLSDQVKSYIDLDRSRNEIALVDTEKGTVSYGIDSMFKVIAHRFHILKPLFDWKPFHWFMKKFYSFISYNRKVIIPAAEKPGTMECAPDFNLKYRVLYILLANVFSLVLLNHYYTIAFPLAQNKTFIIGLALTVHAVIVGRLALKDKMIKVWDYLGNVTTVFLAATLLLIITNALIKLIGLTTSQFLPILLAAIAVLATIEWVRRIRLLKFL
jgi:predicted DCC family thiol-disulfide oxidoreductase YuxK